MPADRHRILNENKKGRAPQDTKWVTEYVSESNRKWGSQKVKSNDFDVIWPGGHRPEKLYSLSCLSPYFSVEKFSFSLSTPPLSNSLIVPADLYNRMGCFARSLEKSTIHPILGRENAARVVRDRWKKENKRSHLNAFLVFVIFLLLCEESFFISLFSILYRDF